jgi:hypothetical protein
MILNDVTKCGRRAQVHFSFNRVFSFLIFHNFHPISNHPVCRSYSQQLCPAGLRPTLLLIGCKPSINTTIFFILYLHVLYYNRDYMFRLFMELLRFTHVLAQEHRPSLCFLREYLRQRVSSNTSTCSPLKIVYQQYCIQLISSCVIMTRGVHTCSPKVHTLDIRLRVGTNSHTYWTQTRSVASSIPE